MWDWCCVLVALWLCRQGLWEFNQSDDYRDARQRSPPTRQQRPKLTSSKKWSLSVRGSLLAEQVWFFTEAAVWLLFILPLVFYYCILIFHRFCFSLCILINTLQNDNKPSWILKYLHECKIQKVRRNRILQMVLETTMMQDKKQAGSETQVKIMWQTGSKNWNMTRKPTENYQKTNTEGGAKCNITNGHAHCDATWLAKLCYDTSSTAFSPCWWLWNCMLIG